MAKRALTVLLALILLVSAAPLACAQPADDGWLIYCAETDACTFAATVVAPAKYTRISDRPQVETVLTTDHDESTVQVPAAEQIPFYSDGKTELRWALTVTCTVPEAYVRTYGVRLAVLPGSVLDDAGNGNARLCFEDEVDYMTAGGYAEIDVYSGLLLCDYSRDAETVAVGDTLRVDYSGLYPIEILINGETAAALPGGELQRYTRDVTAPGTLCVAVRQKGAQIETRTLTVISSREMYRRNLRDGLVTGEDIPGTEDFIQAGLPRGSLFIPLAKIIAFFVGLRVFFHRLFSFVRITQ